MPWDMKDREEAAFLDDFDAEAVKADFVEGFIPPDSLLGALWARESEVDNGESYMPEMQEQ